MRRGGYLKASSAGRDDRSWGERAYLKASSTNTPDWFGGSVALGENALVVGAWGEDGSATGLGGRENANAASGGAAYLWSDR